MLTFPALFKMFLIIIVAFAAVRCGLWDAKTNRALSKIVLYIFNPALAIYSAVSGARPYTNLQVLQFTAVAVGCYVFLVATAFLIPKVLGLKGDSGKVYKLMYLLSNVGFYGIPVVQALFGTEAVLLTTFFNLPFQVVSFTFGVTLASPREEDNKFSFKMLTHPMILACVLAYILYLGRVQVPDFLKEALNFTGQATSPCAMVVVGTALAFVPLKNVFLSWRQYVLSLIKMVLLPVILLTILRLIFPRGTGNDEIVGVAVILMSMPAATNCAMLTSQYQGDYETAASGVFLSTLLSAATIPFLMWLLKVM